jgi:hypothetical protein
MACAGFAGASGGFSTVRGRTAGGGGFVRAVRETAKITQALAATMTTSARIHFDTVTFLSA